MSKIHLDTCPVCGHNHFSDYMVCEDYYATQEYFSLIQCQQCQFVATQDFPSEDTIGRYYHVAEYVSHSDTQKGLINKLYHIARGFALKSKSKIVFKSSQKTTGTLLDIGCGTGYFANKMQELGWQVEGIEKDDETRKFAANKFNIKTFRDNHLFDLEKQSKDVITLWHVLEHIENLNDTMQQLSSILKDDGTLIIALPNRVSADCKHYKNYWAAFDVPRHLWHFSPKDFEYLANKHNFILTQRKSMHFDAFYISMLSEKYKGTPLSFAVGLMKGAIFFLESLFNKDKSSSITYILKKKR